MNWLQVMGPTMLMVIGGLLTWIIKSRIEELRSVEERLMEERRSIYAKILKPFVQLFADMSDKGVSKSIREITSYEYKKNIFEINLIGSDGVVNAYNSMMQYFYKAEASNEGEEGDTESGDHILTMKMLGKLLLEIRKSLGNKKTKLHSLDMLRAMIKDLAEYEANENR